VAPRAGRGVIRRARPDDVDFLVELYADPDVRPFLAAGGDFSREAVAADVELSETEPTVFGLFVIEADGEPAGSMHFEATNRRSRIARCGGLAVHPRFRGRRLADEAARQFIRHLIFELDFHRLEMEIYAFNERSIAHAERAGWAREGVKRNAYRHGDGWVDSVLYAVVREDLEEQ
jgi:RimJ/RimL family protein N-acetyltransferase